MKREGKVTYKDLEPIIRKQIRNIDELTIIKADRKENKWDIIIKYTLMTVSEFTITHNESLTIEIETGEIIYRRKF